VERGDHTTCPSLPPLCPSELFARSLSGCQPPFAMLLNLSAMFCRVVGSLHLGRVEDRKDSVLRQPRSQWSRKVPFRFQHHLRYFDKITQTASPTTSPPQRQGKSHAWDSKYSSLRTPSNHWVGKLWSASVRLPVHATHVVVPLPNADTAR
jgi:hypothetical protein